VPQPRCPVGALYPEFQAAGADVLVILGDSPEGAARYGMSLHVPFPILADPTEAVYHRFGLHKALLLIQRTASVVVDRNGLIRYLKRATNPGTWLQESQELLQVVRQLGGA
jgi:thioredoxin-dependent peroxiredoxin